MLPALLAAGYIALCAAILGSKYVSCLHGFLYYGKVRLHTGTSQETPPILARVLDLTVPKKWFAHFYGVYAVLLAAVAIRHHQDLLRGSRYSAIWTLLSVQAGRRLHECAHVTRWSAASRMHVTHYLAGLYFYVAVPVTCAMGLAASTGPVRAPGVLAAAAAFLVFSWDQHRNHVHLARLVKYTAPSAGLFRYVSCAHYFDELGLYACVTALACGGGIQCSADGVFICSMLFVAVNLGASAIETNRYYHRRFPAYSTRHALVPHLL